MQTSYLKLLPRTKSALWEALDQQFLKGDDFNQHLHRAIEEQ